MAPEPDTSQRFLDAAVLGGLIYAAAAVAWVAVVAAVAWVAGQSILSAFGL